MTPEMESASAAFGWDRSDLIGRVLQSLRFARLALGAADGERVLEALGVIADKVVAETAMLLHCAAAIQQVDPRIRDAVDDLAALVGPRARSKDVLAAICLDPGMAVDHAVAHILLSGLGHPDAGVDDVLATSLEMGRAFGPERLAHRQLEREWLARVWPRVWPSERGEPEDPSESLALADSHLGRPLDALGATRIDVYAFTHAVMYASDLGGRRAVLPRPLSAVADDALAALACSVTADDCDLTAEVLLTWPMLGLDWSPAAVFAFGALTTAQDELGFLPGASFDRAHHGQLHGDAALSYAVSTCYHTTYVMGFLCAAALRPGRAPPARLPARTRRGETSCAGLLEVNWPARWRQRFERLSAGEQSALLPLLLAMFMRTARAAGDLRSIQHAVGFALEHDLADGAAPVQAATLLRRCQSLDRALAARD